METETKHLPDAQASAAIAAQNAAALEAEMAARSAARQASLELVAGFGRDHAKGNVALMRTTSEFARMVRAGFASDTVDDARQWYGAFAKGHNGAKLGAESGHNDALKADDSDAVSNLRTFVAGPVVAITGLMPDFHAKVLAVRKDIEAEDRVSTYQSLVRVNRAVRDWGKAGRSFDELTAALEADTFHATVMAWLVPGKGPAKGVVERLNAVVESWAKVAKREKSLTLDAAVVSMRDAVTRFASELQAKADAAAAFDVVAKELAGAALTVGGETIQ